MRIALNIERVGVRYGGAEKYAATLARALAEAGHDVHLVSRAIDRDGLPLSATCHLLKVADWPGLGSLRSYRFARASAQFFDAGEFDLVVGFMKTWRQDVYIAVGGTQPGTLEYNGRRFRSRWQRTLWRLGKLLSPKQWVFRLIARRQFADPPLVIAPSRLVARHFRRYHRVPRERTAVIYNGLDGPQPLAAIDARGCFRRGLGLTPGEVALLFVARNYELKGLEPLLEAFATVAARRPQARLVVCGSRRDGRFRRQARRLGIDDRVSFLGFVPDVVGAFAGCDVFAFPTFYDPCSLVVLEAMAAGLPVVTTRQNGAAELMVEGEDGFVVGSPWDVRGLAAALDRLVVDDALRVRMAAAARRHARDLTVDRRLEELWAALARAAGGHSALRREAA